MKNLKAGPVTTILGVAVIIAAIASVFLAQSMSWLDASIGIGIGLALMFAPDSILSRVTSMFARKDDAVNPVPNEPQAPQTPE